MPEHMFLLYALIITFTSHGETQTGMLPIAVFEQEKDCTDGRDFRIKRLVDDLKEHPTGASTIYPARFWCVTVSVGEPKN